MASVIKSRLKNLRNYNPKKGDIAAGGYCSATREKLEDQRCSKSITVYYDEGKIEQDALPRKGWFLKEQPAQIESSSPGKKDLILFGRRPVVGKSNHDASQTL